MPAVDLTRRIELPIGGMDCAECVAHVEKAIGALPGVTAVTVLLAAERATVHYDAHLVQPADMRRAVESAGYTVPDAAQSPPAQAGPVVPQWRSWLAVALILLLVVTAEWFGWLTLITDMVPWPIGWATVLIVGYPSFRKVVLATFHGQIISHTLMSLGVVAALAVGQWGTAVIVALFMRIGARVESFTAGQARRSLAQLADAAPRVARVERDGAEVELPLAEVIPGDVVVVRPGEKIPVDGVVLEGLATVDQSALTGESMPLEAAPGSQVFAASLTRLGHLRIEARKIGAETTFGQVIRLVEEAESNRATVQQVADRFSGYYLPLILAVSLLTLALRRDPLAMAAVLVVACSCSIALATPMAMLATLGAEARRGVLVKGGKFIEALARADVILLDKTGTLTLGQPQVTDVVPLGGITETELLTLSEAAERYSEHPVATAVRARAEQAGLSQVEVRSFRALPGVGIQAVVAGAELVIGSRLAVPAGVPLPPQVAILEAEGKTLLFVVRDAELIGIVAVADELRTEVPAALKALRGMGLAHIELLSGDHEQAVARLTNALGIPGRGGMLPDDKIRVVREYQAQGHTVIMIGDGVNDAPALAQADVGIALAGVGSDLAIAAAHVALMREDWFLIPALLRSARRTMRVVKTNLLFTAVYNVLGVTLAAFGLLPPVWAAALQSIPDLGILGNSSRLLRSAPDEPIPALSEAPS